MAINFVVKVHRRRVASPRDMTFRFTANAPQVVCAIKASVNQRQGSIQSLTFVGFQVSSIFPPQQFWISVYKGVWVNPTLFNRVGSVLGSFDPTHSVSALVNPQLVANHAAANYNAELNMFHFRDEALGTAARRSIRSARNCPLDRMFVSDKEAAFHVCGQYYVQLVAALLTAIPKTKNSTASLTETAVACV